MTTAIRNRHGSAVVTLPRDTDIVITRAFDAPAALVYRAYTTPEPVKRWWGFETSEWLVCEIDLPSVAAGATSPARRKGWRSASTGSTATSPTRV